IGQSNYVLLVDLEAGRELLSRSSTIAVEIIGIASFWKKTQRKRPQEARPEAVPRSLVPLLVPGFRYFRAETPTLVAAHISKKEARQSREGNRASASFGGR